MLSKTVDERLARAKAHGELLAELLQLRARTTERLGESRLRAQRLVSSTRAHIDASNDRMEKSRRLLEPGR